MKNIHNPILFINWRTTRIEWGKDHRNANGQGFTAVLIICAVTVHLQLISVQELRYLNMIIRLMTTLTFIGRINRARVGDETPRDALENNWGMKDGR